MPKPMVTIEQWSVVRSIVSPSYAELQPGNHLKGVVFEHAKFKRLSLVYTSHILSVDFSQAVVETLNTTYRLGEPSDEYRAWLNKRIAA